MESNQPLDSNFGEGLHLSGQSLEYLKETAKWAKFLAIVGFVMLGLILLIFIGMALFLGSVGLSQLGGQEAAMLGGMGLAGGLFYVLFFIAVYFMPILFLYRFGVKMQAALRTEDSDVLQSALSNIKSHYKYIGILLIIVLALYGLMLLFAIFFGGMAAMMG